MRESTYSGKCRVIISDIDETFVTSDKRIPEQNLQAVRRILDAGMDFVFATGRYWPSLRTMTEPLGLKSPQIVDNGAVVIKPEGEVVLSRHPVGRDCLKYFYCGLRDAGFIPILSSGKEYHAANMTGHLNEQLVAHSEMTDVIPEQAIMDKLDDYVKLVVFAQERCDELEAAAAKLLESAPANMRFSSVFTEQGIFVITAEGISKAAGIESLCRHLGCNPEDTVSVGDGDNDVEMLGFTGRSFVVANATAKAKKAATDFVPSNNECGFAVAVDRILAGL